jgi:hypothetical protein
MVKNCSICNSSNSDFNLCEIHLKAYENINASYKDWAKAFNNKLSTDEYLRRILNLQYTGDAIREVARYLLENNTSLIQNE